jgi:glutamyl-tRNA synthetase
MQYDEDGFLPEALFNYLARLGWSHGDDEVFSREQLRDWFDLGHVNRAPAQYDIDKLHWMNGEYMKRADDARLAGLAAPRLARRLAPGAAAVPQAALVPVVGLYKDRSRTLEELADEAVVYFEDPTVDPALLAQHLQGPVRDALAAFATEAQALGEWRRETLLALVKKTVAGAGLKMPQFAIPLRVALAGRTQTPSIDAVLELLGREAVVRRIGTALSCP